MILEKSPPKLDFGTWTWRLPNLPGIWLKCWRGLRDEEFHVAIVKLELVSGDVMITNYQDRYGLETESSPAWESDEEFCIWKPSESSKVLPNDEQIRRELELCEIWPTSIRKTTGSCFRCHSGAIIFFDRTDQSSFVICPNPGCVVRYGAWAPSGSYLSFAEKISKALEEADEKVAMRGYARRGGGGGRQLLNADPERNNE